MRNAKSRLEKLERHSGKRPTIVVDHIYIEPGQHTEDSREQPEYDADVLVVHSSVPSRDSEVR